MVVIPGNDAVAVSWGRLSAAATLRGRPRPVNDMWVAACCLTYDLAGIDRDLVRTLRHDIITDWVARDDVRAKIRSTIKRGYPQTPRRRPSSGSWTRWKPSPTTGPPGEGMTWLRPRNPLGALE